MVRIVLFLLFVLFLVTVILMLKTFYDKAVDKDKPVESKDDLDRVVDSWERSENKN